MVDRGAVLLGLARAVVEAAVMDRPAPEPPEELDWLAEPGAVFVTLKLRGRLRGCIGSLEARRSLGQDVIANARSAALEDPRFPPVVAHELPAITLSVAELSAPEPITFSSQGDALARLRPGVDGVVLRFEGRRSTFLPQVWDELPEPDRFLGELKRKAGLPATFWGDGIQLWRYSVTSWCER